MPPASGQQEADNSLGPLWITLGLFVLGGFIWYFFSTEIIAFILNIRLYETDFINLFVPSSWTDSLNSAKQFILTAKQGGYSGVTFTDLMDISNVVGNYIRYPIAVVLVGLGALMYFSNPLARFKKVYTMRMLLDAEKDNWPQVIPVAKLNLAKQDIHKGPWAMAMQPMQFAKANNLVVFEQPKVENRFATKMQPTASINRDDARRTFAMQMGRYWVSPEALPIHARALFAVFAARVNGDRDNAQKLLDHISRSTGSGKPDYTGAEQLLRKHKDNKYIIRLTKRHAFELTVMASLLEFARQDGVIATADFLWLKPVDRKLWYMLNTVGRQTPFCEIAGPFAHWIAEKEFGKRLNVPMVEEAVTGLEMAIKEIIYHPDEDEEG